MARIINWFGVAAGIITLLLLLISIYIPWWQLTIGNGFLTVWASPIVTNFGLNGSQFNIPLIWAWNLSNILLFTAGGLIMLLYSFMPTKKYSIELLGFAWKKPLYAFVSFTVGLIIIVIIAGFFDMNFPLMGTQEVTFAFPSFIPISASITSLVTATFMLPFWFAIVAVTLCVAAKIYHEKIEKKVEKIAAAEMPPTAPAQAPTPASTLPPPPPSPPAL